MHDETLRAMIEAPLLELARAREFAVSTVEIPPARPASAFCPECGGSLRDWPARLPGDVRCANEWHPLACSPLFGHHSDDRTQIHYGAESPALMCGRHASYLSPSEWERMRAGGTVPAFPIPKIP